MPAATTNHTKYFHSLFWFPSHSCTSVMYACVYVDVDNNIPTPTYRLNV